MPHTNKQSFTIPLWPTPFVFTHSQNIFTFSAQLSCEGRRWLQHSQLMSFSVSSVSSVSVSRFLHFFGATKPPELLARGGGGGGGGGAMCLVQTPYYHLCGHDGRPMVAPNGRCARAEHTPGACWEPQDTGIKTVETRCINCERFVKIPENQQIAASRVGPVDCHKFNQLIKQHKQTCDRRYCPILFAPSTSPADNEHSASVTSIPSSVTSDVFLRTADELALRRFSMASSSSLLTSPVVLQPADDLALRRPSTASEISVASITASTMSTEGRPPILTIDSPPPAIRTPSWTTVEEWTKQTEQKSPETPIPPNQYGSPKTSHYTHD
jgi:hypothetical protein